MSSTDTRGWGSELAGAVFLSVIKKFGNTILQQVIPKYTSPLTPAEVLLEYTDSWAPARGVGEKWSGTRVSELFLSSSGAFLGQVAGTIAEPP